MFNLNELQGQKNHTKVLSTKYMHWFISLKFSVLEACLKKYFVVTMYFKKIKIKQNIIVMTNIMKLLKILLKFVAHIKIFLSC